MIESWLIESWPARNEWIKDGQVDIDHLREKYGDYKVPVANCTTFECEDWERGRRLAGRKKKKQFVYPLPPAPRLLSRLYGQAASKRG